MPESEMLKQGISTRVGQPSTSYKQAGVGEAEENVLISGYYNCNCNFIHFP
jgi:hypothetical protein